MRGWVRNKRFTQQWQFRQKYFTSSKVVVFQFLYNFGRCQCVVQKPATSSIKKPTRPAGTKKPTRPAARVWTDMHTQGTLHVCEKPLRKTPSSSTSRCRRIDEKVTLFCPAGYTIQIMRAFYGRDTCWNGLCFEYQSCRKEYCSKGRCTCRWHYSNRVTFH